MKKNGFTLVEVLLVLVILGVIAVIFIPEATKLLKENDKKIYKAKEEIRVLSYQMIQVVHHMLL